MKVTHVLVVAALALAAPVLTAQDQQAGEIQLKAAMHRELVDGNLRAAIADYQAVVSKYGANHPVAARALLQIGRCYEKLGQKEARAAYERLLRDYADQSALVAEARAGLAALAGGDAVSRSASATGPVVHALPQVDALNDIRSLSPDGTKATFGNYDNDAMNVAVYDFTSRQATLLTNFDWTTTYACCAIWSPDGRQVAYLQAEYSPGSPSELRTATLTGESRVILRFDAGANTHILPADWLADGRRILVVIQRADKSSAIGFVPAAGGPFTELRSLQWKGGGRTDLPSASPDGRFVAFADGAIGMRDIHVVSADGRTDSRLTDDPADDSQPRWSPDGRYLAFTSNRGGSTALWAIAVKDGQAAGEPFRINEGMQDTSVLNWTTHGLAYVQRPETLDIYTIDVDRSTLQPTGHPRQLTYSRTGRNVGPAWSPDGRFLAFVSSSPADAEHRYLVVMPSGGGDPREFLIPTSRYRYPGDPYDLRWFGDGNGLGFSGTDGHGDPVLFRVTLAAGRWDTYPLAIKTWTRIEWNADGSRYFYVRQDLAGDAPIIYEHDLASGSERVVFRAAAKTAILRQIRLGPDRRSLAMTATAIDGKSEIRRVLVVDTQSGEARTIAEETSGPSPDASVSFNGPFWSPDGRTVIVPEYRGTATLSQLRFLPLDGGTAHSSPVDALVGRPAIAPGDVSPYVFNFVLTPDGTRMAFVRMSGRQDAHVIENAVPASPRR